MRFPRCIKQLQVFRKMNGLAEEIQKSQPSVDLWRKFIYCSSLTGSVLGIVDHMQPQGMNTPIIFPQLIY